jgi:hypothetical protein
MTALLCLASATTVVSLAAPAFTIAWNHSIEHVRWEEDYRIVGHRIELVEARIQGSAAGMDPPPGARFDGVWWHYAPADRWHDELRLTRSPFTADYELCIEGRCRSLAEVLPQKEGVTRAYACK